MIGSYLLDEHLPRWWPRAIVQRHAGLTVWRIGDPGSPPRASPDPDLLGWCEAHDFFLVTNNRATMPGHLADHLAQGRHIPGILLIDTGLPIAELADELALISGAGQPDEFRDLIRHLPL